MAMPEGFASLPPVLQVAATMALVILGGGVAFYQFSSKWLGRFAPKTPSPAPKAGAEAVVVSAAFADGRPVRELTEAIRDLSDLMASLRSVQREQSTEQARTTDAVNRLSQRVERVADLLDDRLPHGRDGRP